MLNEIIHEAVEITISGHDHRFLVVWKFNHRVQDELCVNIPFHHSIRQTGRWLKDDDVAVLLQGRVEAPVFGDIADEEESFGDVVFIREVSPELPEIECLALRTNGEVHILAVDKCIIALGFFHAVSVYHRCVF